MPSILPLLGWLVWCQARIWGSSDLSGEWVRGEMVGGLQNRG